jgi:hypothetical protein
VVKFDHVFRLQAKPAKKFRAVSAVVERLVYTEKVGGSKPSPSILAAAS